MAAERVLLGPYALQRVVGHGAMGRVWQAVHREQDVDVAVKVMHPRPDRATRVQAVFRNEVRQVARLSHPGIVMILDYGDVDADTAAASDGRLRAGSRFIAMEFASRGSLDQQGRLRSWAEMRAVLLSVLDALAHAHASGVLHRDIKPENILMAGARDARPGVKLTDFGIAWALDEGAGTAPLSAGTAEYMAPEQARARWRDQGPWTDLYALGCVAWSLVTGRPPYTSGNKQAVLRAHVDGQLPPLEPRLDLPHGFEAWVRRLLAPRPADRFRFAADAASALRSLSDAVLGTGLAASTTQALHTAATTLDLSDAASLPPDGPPAPDSVQQGAATAPRPHRSPGPALPRSWRRPAPPPPPPRLVGAGLRLYGLRSVPLVGREAERDALWSTLRGVAEQGRPQAVVVLGEPGVGKSALSRWLGRRAHEVGAAHVLQARHAPIPSQAHGLGRMVARHLAAVNLDGEELDRRIGGLHHCWPGLADAVGADALRTLVRPPATTASRPAPEAARHAAVVRLVRHLAQDRPVLLELEDAHWGADSLALVARLLEGGHSAPLPVLCVLTAREDEGSAEAQRRLQSLATHPAARSLRLPPLAEDEQVELIAELLSLEDEAARRVQERTQGNPLFAVQLVGDWVRRRVLSLGTGGFHLRERSEAVLPDDIHALWQARLEAVLGDRGAHDHAAVQVAAALGQEVDFDEWAAACAAAGCTPGPDLYDLLAEAGLADLTDAGWRTAHGMLRESVERAARERGSWATVNAACATMLAAREPARAGDAGRIGRHLEAAGQLQAALEPLRAGARQALGFGELYAAADLLTLRERCIDRLALPAADHRRGEGLVLRLHLQLSRSDFDQAELTAAQLSTEARRHSWARLHAKALRGRGMVAEKRGDLDMAEAMLLQAERAARRAGATEDLGACLEHRGTVARLRGEIEVSRKLLEDALTAYDAAGSPLGRANCRKELAATLLKLGQLGPAESNLRLAAATFTDLGDSIGRVHALNNLGEVLRAGGRLDEAERVYREAHALAERMGSHERVITGANVGLLQLQAGRMEAAADALRTALQRAQRTGRRGVSVYLHLALLQCAAHERDWGAWDHHLRTAQARLEETGMADAELASLAEAAAEAARSRGRSARADAAQHLADAQRALLDHGPTG